MRLDDLRIDIAQQRRVDQQLLRQVIDDEDAGAAHEDLQRTTRSGRALRLMPSAPLRTTSSSSACWASVWMKLLISASLAVSSTTNPSGAGSRTRPPVRTT